MQRKNTQTPKYKLILFDADGTLFDYDMAEGAALRKAFEKYCFTYSEDIRNKYREINSSMWKEFESGKIDKANLQISRFERLLNVCNYDADASEFNLLYLDILAESGQLNDGALEICKELSQFCTLAITTNGIARTQKGRLKNSQIQPYISYIIVSEDAGHQKPHNGFFQYAFDACGIQDKKSAIIIGDSLSTDIKGGIDFGIETCWYNPNGIKAKDLKADYEIEHLNDLIKIIL